MKGFKLGLRIWISAASVFSFLVGWILFAHSNKPAPLFQNQPAQNAPLLSFNNSQAGLSSFSLQQQSPFRQPRLRTRGS